KLKAVFSVLVIVFTIIMAVLTQGDPERNAMALAAESIYQMICGVFILLLQFGVMERAKLELSIGAMRELVHEQHEQYRHSKQSVELVNEKYHDLKSLLEGFHGEISREQIDTLKARVGEYDTHIETGNHVLDIVLSEKRAIAAARKIDFTSFVDGKGLDFIEELDLYSLVGNALNNAIDAVSKLPEGERFITMTLRAEGGVVTMHVENPYGGDVVMENELPKTQRDERYHGFGMKSMERICEKYDGTLAVKAEGGIFSLDAVLLEP
ncbi:MAG: sensor histidine kinase, partial [Oscillospiraceae bacterium]|nr:sensor histidine kinase [Oscillospiraceae bacterium]